MTTHPGDNHRRLTAGRALGTAAALLSLIGLAAAWRWTPLAAWLDAELIAAWAAGLRDSTLGPAVAVTVFVAGGVVVLPVSVLVVATALVFGPLPGFLYSMLGTVLSGATTYALGRALGRHTVRQVAGERVNRVSRRLAQRGMTTMAAIRLVPVAPFTVVNVVAGASHIGFRDFVMGTAIGMIPVVAALTLFADRLMHVVERPAPRTVLALAAVSIGLVLAGTKLSRCLNRRRHTPESP